MSAMIIRVVYYGKQMTCLYNAFFMVNYNFVGKFAAGESWNLRFVDGHFNPYYTGNTL